MDWFNRGHGDGAGGKVHPGQHIQGPVRAVWGFVTYSRAPLRVSRYHALLPLVP